MLFNSFQFLTFFIPVYALYLCFPHRWQNRLLLLASYLFYAAWDWRFLSLIWISTIVDYICGLKINASENFRHRKLYLALSVGVNLSILGFFKYFNFFASSLQGLSQVIGWDLNPATINIILPVGISFYTFQTMSYTIDVYRKEIQPTKHFLDFALFVAFFPQLIAGPIERAKRLLPQILNKRDLNWGQFCQGCYLILWGLFLKIFIADNLAILVDPVFAADASPHNGEIWIALYAFAFQIYCDFAGYSHIARGLGKVMGIELMINFNLPYFSNNPQEFWSRWHISLSSWLRDYLYIPLGGNQKGTLKTYRNLTLTMLLGGLWHGASWTFVVWGLYHGILLVIYRMLNPVLKGIESLKNQAARGAVRILSVFVFFHFICIGWLIFRCHSMHQIISMFKSLFGPFTMDGELTSMAGKVMLYTFLLILIQVFQYREKDLLFVFKKPWPVRTAVYLVLIYSIVIFGLNHAQSFIYFQF